MYVKCKIYYTAFSSHWEYIKLKRALCLVGPKCPFKFMNNYHLSCTCYFPKHVMLFWSVRCKHICWRCTVIEHRPLLLIGHVIICIHYDSLHVPPRGNVNFRPLQMHFGSYKFPPVSCTRLQEIAPLTKLTESREHFQTLHVGEKCVPLLSKS